MLLLQDVLGVSSQLFLSKGTKPRAFVRAFMRACVLTSSTLGSGLLMGLDSWLITDEDRPLMF